MDEFEYYEDVDNYLAIHDRLLQFHVIEEYIKNKEEINSCLTLREFKNKASTTFIMISIRFLAKSNNKKLEK